MAFLYKIHLPRRSGCRVEKFAIWGLTGVISSPKAQTPPQNDHTKSTAANSNFTLKKQEFSEKVSKRGVEPIGKLQWPRSSLNSNLFSLNLKAFEKKYERNLSQL